VSGTWDDIWAILNGRFRRIADSLQLDYPEMSWSAGHSANESFPFRAYATYRPRGEEHEEIVASVDFLRLRNELRYSADIGLDYGRILADGPGGVIEILDGMDPADEEILAATEQVADFLEVSESVFREFWS
jgi:hypothetical protein